MIFCYYMCYYVIIPGIIGEAEKSGKSYAVFAIRITKKFNYDEEMWDVYRRYSDFHDLQMIMSEKVTFFFLFDVVFVLFSTFFQTPPTLLGWFVHTHTQWPTWNRDERWDFALLQVLHELWDFVSLFQNSSLSPFYQVMRVYVRKFKVNPLHDCITIVLGKELFMGGIRALRSHF